jgi:hypothetical protein
MHHVKLTELQQQEMETVSRLAIGCQALRAQSRAGAWLVRFAV